MQEELEARLNRLERENQRMKRGALLLIVLAFGVACVGQTQGPRVSDEVRTRRLIVEDGSGNTVAELKDIQGGGWLALYDGTEKPRVQLSAILDSQGLTFYDKSGQNRVDLTADENRTSLCFHDKAGKARAQLSVYTLSRLSLWGETRRDEAGLYVWEGGPDLMLSDSSGVRRAGLTVFKGGPEFSLYDEAKNVIWKAP